MNGWIYLIIAILFEITGTTSLKLSNGLTDLKYTVVMILFYILSLAMLSLALEEIEIGIAYAVWAGVGIAIITLIGIIYFGDTVNILKMVFITLIIIGVVGLNLVGAGH